MSEYNGVLSHMSEYANHWGTRESALLAHFPLSDGNECGKEEPMEQVICPIDGKPCDTACPDRYRDRPEGGCLLAATVAMSDITIIMFNKDD